MANQAGKSRSDTEERLLKKKFGKWYEWKKPKIIKTIGPYTPDAFDFFNTHLERLFEKAELKLTTFSHDELTIADENDTPTAPCAREWQAYLQKEINLLGRQCPSWVAGGFGNSKYSADFKYWVQMEKLTLHEALLVSVGIEPMHFKKDAISDMKKEMGKIKIHPALEFLVRRNDLFQRKFQFGYSDYVPMNMDILKKWFGQIELEIHPEFRRALEKRFPDEKKRKGGGGGGGENLNSQERKSLLKLIAGMACEQYSYDPKKQRSTAVSSIRDDLEAVGLDMDSKTVRRWLTEAARQVPESYWKK